MPAIQLARLRIKVAELAEYFQQPDYFVNHLHHLFEFYSDRTRRPKKKGAPPPSLKSFNIPQPVFRHLIVELNPLIENDPDAAIRLVDRCWLEPVLEYRQLTIHLISMIPPIPIERVLDRLIPWLEETIEDSLIQEIFDIGFNRIKNETQQEYLKIVEKWLNNKDKKQQVFGLIGLETLLKIDSFDNLPAIFRLMNASLIVENKGFRPYYINIFKVLVQNSEQETGYFLKGLLANSPNKEVQWLARHVLAYFPLPFQGQIKAILRSNR